MEYQEKGMGRKHSRERKPERKRASEDMYHEKGMFDREPERKIEGYHLSQKEKERHPGEVLSWESSRRQLSLGLDREGETVVFVREKKRGDGGSPKGQERRLEAEGRIDEPGWRGTVYQNSHRGEKSASVLKTSLKDASVSKIEKDFKKVWLEERMGSWFGEMAAGDKNQEEQQLMKRLKAGIAKARDLSGDTHWKKGKDTFEAFLRMRRNADREAPKREDEEEA